MESFFFFFFFFVGFPHVMCRHAARPVVCCSEFFVKFVSLLMDCREIHPLAWP